MSLRTLPLLAALLFSLAPLPAIAQTPAPGPAYHWHSLTLQHAAPIEILRQMHWNGTGPTPNTLSTQVPAPDQAANNPALPEGVRLVSALQGNNALLIEATPEGYARIKALVGPLDVAPRRIEIKVEFVTAKIADVDGLGLIFDSVRLPDPVKLPGMPTAGGPNSFLKVATGGTASQLYLTLTQARGHLVSALPVTTPVGVAATISVDVRVPDEPMDIPWSVPVSTRFPHLTHLLAIQGALTLTPHVLPDGTVGLELLPPTGDKTVALKPVHSGDPLVLIATVMPDFPILGGLFRTRNKAISGDELLVFITPTIVGESDDRAPANANGGQSVTVTP